MKVHEKKSKGGCSFDCEQPTHNVSAREKHDSQQADDGERSRCYGIMPHHKPLQTHQKEVYKYGEGAEARKCG